MPQCDARRYLHTGSALQATRFPVHLRRDSKRRVEQMRFILILCLVISLAWSASAEPELFKKVGNWEVVYGDEGGVRFCFAAADYEDETNVSIGLFGEVAEWRQILTNPNWGSITEYDDYPLNYVFDGRRSWRVDTVGLDHALIAIDLEPRLVEDFAGSMGLEIAHQGTRVIKLTLKGTRTAVNAVEACHRIKVLRPDPFAPNDPFAQAAPTPEPGLRFAGRSVVSDDRVLRVTLGETLSVDDLALRFPSYRVSRNFDVPEEVGDVLVSDARGNALLHIFYARGSQTVERVISWHPGVEGPNDTRVGEALGTAPVKLSCSLGLATTCAPADGSWYGGKRYGYADYIFEPGRCPGSTFHDAYHGGGTSTIGACEAIAGLIMEGYWPEHSEQETLLPYGSRVGMEMTVIERHALGSKSARITLEHTRENALSFCEQYSNTSSEECIQSTIEDTGAQVRLLANCETGEFFWRGAYAVNHRYKGRKTAAQSPADGPVGLYLIERQDTGDRWTMLGNCTACGYVEALVAFAELCPNRNVDTAAY